MTSTRSHLLTGLALLAFTSTAASGCIFVDDSVCGDGIRESGEQCDDGNNRGGDGCSPSCFIETNCGDGIREGGEQCDDGNNLNNDGCDANCFIETACGDGVLDGLDGEECDDGNNLDNDGCSADCLLEGSFCGDGFIDAIDGEECDDGNNFNNDGCDANCLLESSGYLVCDSNADCGGRDDCFTISIPEEDTIGGVCTHACSGDGECMSANGFTGACYSLSGSAAVCFQRCDDDVDCFVGNVCISVTRTDGARTFARDDDQAVVRVEVAPPIRRRGEEILPSPVTRFLAVLKAGGVSQTL